MLSATSTEQRMKVAPARGRCSRLHRSFNVPAVRPHGSHTPKIASRCNLEKMVGWKAGGRDLESAGPKGLCGFDSPSRHQSPTYIQILDTNVQGPSRPR